MNALAPRLTDAIVSVCKCLHLHFTFSRLTDSFMVSYLKVVLRTIKVYNQYCSNCLMKTKQPEKTRRLNTKHSNVANNDCVEPQ